MVFRMLVLAQCSLRERLGPGDFYQASLNSSLCGSLVQVQKIYPHHQLQSFAHNHRTWKTGLPIHSAVLKSCVGKLVVGWVITSEYLLLIVLPFCSFLRSGLLFVAAAETEPILWLVPDCAMGRIRSTWGDSLTSHTSRANCLQMLNCSTS